MKYISLFAGIGGFDLALNRLGHSCVWANEWDKYAAQIYDKNFRELGERTRSTERVRPNGDSADSQGEPRESNKDNATEIYNRRLLPESNQKLQEGFANTTGRQAGFEGIDTRDIRTIPTSQIPDHDLLVGGFPCQAFSIAGKRKGFDDTRGTLFFEIARILRDKRPRYFILENVKGLLSHDNGKTFSTILGVLTDLGYDLQWQVLNSKNFGVPQNRERVFIVGHIRGQPRPEVFPISECGGTNKGLVYTQKADREIARVYSPEGIAPTLHLKTGGWQEPKISNTVRSSGRGSYGKKQNRDSYEFDGRVRRLTPTECERLQGFPDGWTEGVSDTQRYKCLGNAVTVNVVYEVARRLVNE